MRRLLVLAALTACVQIPPPQLVPIAVEPEQFEAMYHDLERCSGIKGDYYGLAWYTTPSHYDHGNHFDAFWRPGGIVINQDKLKDEELIRHEMMHDLLKTAAHPRKYFKGVCGDLSLGDIVS